jgi:hypothetical protein
MVLYTYLYVIIEYMDNIEPAINTAKQEDKILQIEDRGESTGLMEPLVLSGDSRHRPALNDIAIDLAMAASGRLHEA